MFYYMIRIQKDFFKEKMVKSIIKILNREDLSINMYFFLYLAT